MIVLRFQRYSNNMYYCYTSSFQQFLALFCQGTDPTLSVISLYNMYLFRRVLVNRIEVRLLGML